MASSASPESSQSSPSLVAALVSTTEAMNGTAAGIHASTAQAVRRLTAGATGAFVVTLLLGRDWVLYTATWQWVNLIALGAAFVLAATAAWLVWGADTARHHSTATQSD